MKSFFFYDLETSALSARDGRIMQFAGQRTDLDLKPIGQPINVMVRLSDDILPDPGAIMVTGITPQMTLADGLSEPEFCQLLDREVFTADTVTVGFNNVRFDDEFIRHTLWRNFYDPYEWAWSDGRSRWDMLDIVRLTRALRPDGIDWPVNDEGRPVNKLELLASSNGLIHTKAHDALSDVEALIGLSGLIKQKQPKLFDYLFSMRDKKAVAGLVDLSSPRPLVYASGRYPAEHHNASVVLPIAPGPKPNSVLVYDLRHDPTIFAGVAPRALAGLLFASREQRADPDFKPFPVKELVLNKCPAIAPLGVLDEAAQARLGLSLDTIERHLSAVTKQADLGDRAREAFEMREPYQANDDVEHQLYDGFLNDRDKGRMSAIRAADGDELADFHPEFNDDRLTELLLRYKARSYPSSLSQDERQKWEDYRRRKLKASLPGYMTSLQAIAAKGGDDFLLQELQLWAEAIMPTDD